MQIAKCWLLNADNQLFVSAKWGLKNLVETT